MITKEQIVNYYKSDKTYRKRRIELNRLVKNARLLGKSKW